MVVDLDPLDGADRRDADAAAAVGVLLEAVLVVELRVAPPGRLERVGQRRRRRPARSASRPMYSPCAVAGSSALLMRVMRPSSETWTFISSSPSGFTSSSASRMSGAARGEQRLLDARRVHRVAVDEQHAARRSSSRAHHSE